MRKRESDGYLEKEKLEGEKAKDNSKINVEGKHKKEKFRERK